MHFDEETVRSLARLCRIKFSEEEIQAYVADLKCVLDYVEQLQEVNLNHLTPYSHIEEQGVDSLREDKIERLLSRDVFLSNAPDKIAGMIRVPPVLKEPP